MCVGGGEIERREGQTALTAAVVRSFQVRLEKMLDEVKRLESDRSEKNQNRTALDAEMQRWESEIEELKVCLRGGVHPHFFF